MPFRHNNFQHCLTVVLNSIFIILPSFDRIQKIIRVNATKAPDTSKTTNFDTAYNYAEDDDELYDEDYYEYDESNEVNSTTPAPSAANTNKKTKTKGELHLIKGNEMVRE